MDAGIGWAEDRIRVRRTTSSSIRQCSPTAFSSRILRHAPSVVLFAEGQSATAIYELLEGKVAVERGLVDGRRQIVDIVGAGRFFGLTDGATRRCRARCVSTCLVRVLDRDANRENAEFTDWVARAVFLEIDRLERLALSLGQTSARERLIGFLLSLAGDQIGDTFEIELPLSRV